MALNDSIQFVRQWRHIPAGTVMTPGDMDYGLRDALVLGRHAVWISEPTAEKPKRQRLAKEPVT